MSELLIVDDDHDIAELLADVLVQHGHRVRIAADGEAGLRAIALGIPDAVLLDVEMPILTGPEMAYQLFLQNCGRERIPIVLLSGIVDLERIAARVGTPYFLSKPYSPSAVLALCERALSERVAPTPAWIG